MFTKRQPSRCNLKTKQQYKGDDVWRLKPRDTTYVIILEYYLTSFMHQVIDNGERQYKSAYSKKHVHAPTTAKKEPGKGSIYLASREFLREQASEMHSD